MPSPRLPAAALCLCLATAAGMPWAARAQSAVAAAPAIEALEVNADAAFQPGSTLDFMVRGTPRGIARVRVEGSDIDMALAETAPGTYTGTYTVKRSDRLQSTALIRATLLAGGRTTASTFSFPPSFAVATVPPVASAAPASPPVAVQAPPPPAAQVRIDRFEATPVQRLEPGAQLRFAVEGAPGATVTVQWPGLAGALLLREERPGKYAGTYTLREQDTIGNGPVVATLSSGPRRATAQLATPLVQAGLPSAAPAGTMGAAAQSALPLEVTSPGPNAIIDTSQAVLSGRTAPGALVRVRVDAIPPAAPGRAVVAQSVTQQTVQADANGSFSVRIGPNSAPPGSRLEVQLTATQGTRSTPEQRLVLFQRQG